MFHNALFIGWGTPVRGREQAANKVFGEVVEMLGTWKSQGKIQSMTPVFLTPHGGDLAGFFLITGEPTKLAELMNTEEMRRAVTRSQLVAENFGVVWGQSGDEVGKQMALWNASAAELSK
jgi:hypothetical protein